MRVEPHLTVASSAPPPGLLAPPALTVAPPVLLFGRDEGHRPHASRFDGVEMASVEETARLMGLHLTVADTDALRALAEALPAGRIFESGRGFVPYVKGELYTRLLAATGTPDTPRPLAAASKGAEAPPPAVAGAGSGGSSDSPSGAAKAPTDWGSIGVGSLVLACEGPMQGWFEAVVVATKADNHVQLRWRDWPREPEITRARTDLGLMPPGSREGLG